MPINHAPDTNESLSAVLKAALRDGERFCVFKTSRYYAVFDTSEISREAAGDLLEDIDAKTSTAHLLKNGTTCFVCSVNLGGKRFVIKRYNPKGWLHSVRHTLKRSRARRGWLNAHRLRHLGISTPRPAGFIEEYAGCLVTRSWLITELAPGPKLHEYLADMTISKAQKTAVIDNVFGLLTRLDAHCITHGDLKHVNLIVTDEGPTLIDLDSLKVHKTGLFYLYHRKKDLAAFDFTP